MALIDEIGVAYFDQEQQENRVEELEKENDELKKQVEIRIENLRRQDEYLKAAIEDQSELEAKISKAIDALERIICHVESGEGYLDIGIIAERTVTELGGRP